MNKLVAIVLVSFGFATPALAATQALFPAGRAMVIIQGPAGDMDAPNLFEAMNVPPVDAGNVMKKQVSFKSAAGEELFDLSCNVSKTVANYGSCTLQVFGSSRAHIDRQKRQVLFMVSYPDAPRIARSFTRPDEYGHIYFSVDKRVGIAVDQRNGYVDSFRLFYLE